MKFPLILIPLGLLSALLFWTPWPLLLVALLGAVHFAVLFCRGSVAYLCPESASS